jgi:hypothetical protein
VESAHHKERFMTCPKCSTANPAHARFCGTCGHTLATQPGTVPGAGKAATFFKWVGYFFTGLILLGILTNL